VATRTEQKRSLREERKRREEADARRVTTRKRLGLLGGAVAAAAVVVVALVLLGSGGGESKSVGHDGRLTGVAQTNRLLRGIPQRGEVLGRRDAPVTLVQFVDMQCPFCAQFDTTALSDVIRRYVRTGRVRLEQRTLRILGDDSATAASYAAAAAQRDRLFQFSGIFYRNQGQENTGYVTPSYLAKVGRGAGLDPAALSAAVRSPQVENTLVASEREANRFGFNSTPSLAIGRTGGPLQPLQLSSLTSGAVTAPIDRLLRAGQ
jgi:protein-disulfide isomerase